MDKRLITGTVAGGITLFVLGYLIYGLALADFFASNSGSATGAARDPVIMWAIAVGEFSMAALVTLALVWKGASSTGDGFKTGAIVGLLVGLGYNFITYGVTNISNLTAVTVDPIISLLRVGIAGAVIALVLGKMGGSGSSSEQPAI